MLQTDFSIQRNCELICSTEMCSKRILRCISPFSQIFWIFIAFEQTNENVARSWNPGTVNNSNVHFPFIIPFLKWYSTVVSLYLKMRCIYILIGVFCSARLRCICLCTQIAFNLLVQLYTTQPKSIFATWYLLYLRPPPISLHLSASMALTTKLPQSIMQITHIIMP